jgi:hypothetical protein
MSGLAFMLDCATVHGVAGALPAVRADPSLPPGHRQQQAPRRQKPPILYTRARARVYKIGVAVMEVGLGAGR